MSSALPSFHHDRVVTELVQSLRQRRPLALVGAGASVGSGYPNWPGLIARMEKQLTRAGRLAPKLPEALKDLGDPAWHAEEFVAHLKPAGFRKFIKDNFCAPRPPNLLSEPHHLIARLGFRHFLTTNYDPCIELALKRAQRRPNVVHWSDGKQAQNFLTSLSDASGRPSVVYLHGHHTRPDNVILTETSYAAAYLDDNFVRRLLAIFMTQPIVFIGFSLDDPDLAQLLRIARATFRTNETQHFGIFGYRTAGQREVIARRMERKFGLKSAFYSITTRDNIDDHSALIDLLEYLVEASVKSKGAMPKRSETRPIREGQRLVFKEVSGTDNPHDPHKGKFGGQAQRNGRRLFVRARKEVKKNTYMAFDLVVAATKGEQPITGEVRFQLHPTFAANDYTERVRNGKAVSRIGASYGAFTVGVTILNEGTKLELDLSELNVFPKWFRES
jgi:hypothetical protein